MVATDLKTCPRCETEKALDEFHVDSSKRDGHVSYCKSCACAKARDWAAVNPERKQQTRKAYYLANRDKILRQTSAWQKANPEKFRAIQKRVAAKRGYRDRRAYRRAYAKAHPELVREQEQARRARKAGVIVTSDAGAYESMVRLDPCSYCGGPGGSADHIVPLSMGGHHAPYNLTGACRACNSGKRDKSLLRYLAGKAVV